MQTNLFDGTPSESKQCRQCRKRQLLSEFSTYDNGRGVRHRGRCRTCRNEYQQDIRANGNKAPERPVLEIKRCSACDTIKPLDSFPPNGKRLHSHCRECQRRKANAWRKIPGNDRRWLNKALKARYGITLQQYEDMLQKQNGVCAICKRTEAYPDPRTGKPRRLAVDHAHGSKTFRGLLCSSCNQGIGHFEDDPELLLEAAAYLKRSPK